MTMSRGLLHLRTGKGTVAGSRGPSAGWSSPQPGLPSACFLPPSATTPAVQSWPGISVLVHCTCLLRPGSHCAAQGPAGHEDHMDPGRQRVLDPALSCFHASVLRFAILAMEARAWDTALTHTPSSQGISMHGDSSGFFNQFLILFCARIPGSCTKTLLMS